MPVEENENNLKVYLVCDMCDDILKKNQNTNNSINVRIIWSTEISCYQIGWQKDDIFQQ